MTVVSEQFTAIETTVLSVTFNDLMTAAVASSEWPYDAIMGRCKSSHCVQVRYCVIALAHRSGKFSLSDLGARMNRDHTTILYAIRQMAKLENSNVKLTAMLRQIALSADTIARRRDLAAANRFVKQDLQAPFVLYARLRSERWNEARIHKHMADTFGEMIADRCRDYHLTEGVIHGS